MNVPWGQLLTILSLVCHTESRCSQNSYYKNCWIRRFPGIFIDIEESQRRGAQLLKYYQEETALKCSRTCCLTRNCELFFIYQLAYIILENNTNCGLCMWHSFHYFDLTDLSRLYALIPYTCASRTGCIFSVFIVSCNLAIFHYDTIQENVNCFHLHCPTLESCILSHRGNVILYNITKGESPVNNEMCS